MKKTRQQCTYSPRSSFHSCRHIVFVLSLSPRPSQPWLGTWHVLAKHVTRREPTKRVFVQFIETWPDPLVQQLSCGAYLRVNNISVSCAPIWFSFSFFLSPSLPSFRFFSNTVRHCLANCQDIFSAFCSIRFFKGVTTLLHCEALLGACYHVCSRSELQMF